MRKTTAVIILSALCAGLLSGCANTTPSGWVEVSRNDPKEVSGHTNGWVAGKDSVVLYLYGPSSCTPTPAETHLEGSTLTVKIVKTKGACITTDISGPYRWKYNTEEEIERILVQYSSKQVELPKLN